MTQKRFKLFVGENYGVQTVDGEVIFDSIISIAEADVLVELLNELIEENEQLKKEAEEYNEDAMSYQTLYEQQLEKFEELLSECKHQQQQKMKFYKENKKMIKCKDYGLNCLKCPYWNKWSRYCTKWKIWSESK